MRSQIHRIEGYVELWWNRGVRLKAVSSHGDPVDIAAESAIELAETLLRLWRTPHPPDDTSERGRAARVAAVRATLPPEASRRDVFIVDDGVSVWSDGTPCLKAASASGGAVALSDEAVLDLAEALIRVARMPTPAPRPG